MLSLSSDSSRDLSTEQCAAVAGGRMKLPFQNVSPSQLLTSADGEPVSVYVDGVLVNSVVPAFTTCSSGCARARESFLSRDRIGKYFCLVGCTAAGRATCFDRNRPARRRLACSRNRPRASANLPLDAEATARP